MTVSTLEIDLHHGWQPFGKVLPACQSSARFLCMVAGRRGGKTNHGAHKFIDKVFEDFERVMLAHVPYSVGAARRDKAIWWWRRPRLHYWIVAEITDLLDEAKRALFDVVPPELVDHYDVTQGRLWLKGDILIEFKSGKDPKRLVSAGLNGMWLEEASRLRADAWVGFLRPCLSDKQGWCIVTGTPLGRDWVYEQFVVPARKQVPGYAFYTWVTADNPLPGIQEEVALAKATLPDEYFRREYEASFEAFIGQIFREFSRRDCVIDAVPKGTVMTRICGGGDWGFSAPGCLLVGGVSRDKTVYYLDETYRTSELVEDFWVPEAQRLRDLWSVREWVGDPESPDNLERMNKGGIPMVPHRNVGSGKFDEHIRSVLAGIRLMASLIHRGRLKILSSCTNLIDEIEGYVWKSNPKGGQLDEPAPNQRDHAIDTARYIATYTLQDDALMGLDGRPGMPV